MASYVASSLYVVCIIIIIIILFFCTNSELLLYYLRSTQTVRPPHVYIDVWFTAVFLIEPVVLECSSPAAS